MDLFAGVLSGFKTVLEPSNFLFCFLGVLIGTLIGVLPGIGPVGAVSILLPATFGLSPVAGVITLAGIYYGAMYGGSTTSILVNIPGESASVITCLDGYQMARRGRAGPALGISALGSFIGGTFGVVALMFLAFPLARIALQFGPAEYFSLICMGMTVLIYLGSGSVANSVVMILMGLALSMVGIDTISGEPRFMFGSETLSDGIGTVPSAMGLFGISEVLVNLEGPLERIIYKARIKNLLPSLEDWKRCIGPVARGSVIGFFLGLLPGGGAIISSFVSYIVEKKISKHPEEFGKGAIEGVAGPETANNAGATGTFVPLLALGIPPNAVMALLFGALMIHDVVPGPTLLTKHPEVFWGVIASMYVGNVMLLLLNLPLIGMWVKVLKIPYKVLMPLILLFCLIGCYSINNNPVELIIMVFFGLAGYILRKFNYDLAPLILAFILGPMLETSFRQSLIISGGELSIFIEKPVSAVSLIISALLLISTGFSYYRKTKTRVAQ
jgi:putative tricarboxylic transport membrane protein